MWTLASLFENEKKKGLTVSVYIQNKTIKWIVFSAIRYWRVTICVNTVAKEREIAGFMQSSLIITEIHSWFWTSFYVFPKQDASQTPIHGTINYFEKVLIKNSLSSAPSSVRILCDQAAEACQASLPSSTLPDAILSATGAAVEAESFLKGSGMHQVSVSICLDVRMGQWLEENAVVWQTS